MILKPTVFLSRATPLSRWKKLGILSREMALYTQLHHPTFVSSGNAEDIEIGKEFGIPIAINRLGLSPNLYSLLAPLLHRRVLCDSDVFKTNQLDGSWTAILAGRIYRKPVIVRAGYLWTDSLSRNGAGRFKSSIIHRLERMAFQKATHIILPTEAIAHTVHTRYHVPMMRITVIPNYVDTDLWTPDPSITPHPASLCYAGRLHPAKNLHLLIEALRDLPDCCLTLIGDGPDRERLETLAKHHQVPATFLGMLPHEKIPAILHQHSIFVLPSKLEGHPKALLEAMACGMTVLGADRPGIQNVIRHGENGWLCEPDAQGTANAIQHLLAHPDLCASLGRQARKNILNTCSLEQVVEQEHQLLENICRGDN